jgi:hypothetical protein
MAFLSILLTIKTYSNRCASKLHTAGFEKFFVPCVNISRFLRYRRETRRQRTVISTLSTESILIHH